MNIIIPITFMILILNIIYLNKKMFKIQKNMQQNNAFMLYILERFFEKEENDNK